jgi:carbon-monoxide dehydrogenase large subunit
MESALDAAGWSTFEARRHAARNEGRLIGIGVANYVEGTGRGPYEQVSVRLLPSGKLQVQSGAAPMGQSTKTMLAQIVADQLGGNPDDLILSLGDTNAVSLGFGGFNSRQAVLAGNSAHQAALAVRAKVLKVASIMLEANEADLTIEGASVSIDGTDRRVTFKQLFEATAGLPGYKLPGNLPPGIEATEQVVIDAMTYANGTAVCELEVDPETGEIHLINVVFAHDCGRAIHPKIVDGQVMGGIAHGIGNALFEWMRFDAGGQPVTTTLAEYLLVTATEMPNVRILHHETPTPLNPLGVKGVGESGVIPMAACVISAVEDALHDYGVTVRRTPIGPSDVVELLARRRDLIGE